MTFQATLKKNGVLLDGNKDVTVRIYAKDNPTPVWEEFHGQEVFSGGQCKIELGKITVLTAQVFLIDEPQFGIVIEGEEIQMPVALDHRVVSGMRVLHVRHSKAAASDGGDPGGTD